MPSFWPFMEKCDPVLPRPWIACFVDLTVGKALIEEMIGGSGLCQTIRVHEVPAGLCDPRLRAALTPDETDRQKFQFALTKFTPATGFRECGVQLSDAPIGLLTGGVLAFGSVGRSIGSED